MNNILPQFQRQFRPQANPDAIVPFGNGRFTFLTSRLIRLEYDPKGEFEDRASQPIWYRQQPIPDFDISQTDTTLEIDTQYLHLRYQDTGRPFTPGNLSITLKHSGVTWYFGDEDTGNLLGTFRTLDRADGRIQLEPGLLSRNGWVVIDDSNTLVFNEDGWLEQRERPTQTQDLYFLGYDTDYTAVLQDYGRITGPTPLLPRWALGNWWSRYWAYTQDELQALMADFKQRDVPLSVCIIDMDWHLVDVGEGVNGWTGYTWNRDLFPDPDTFIAWLHSQGLKTALNLHPALGVRPHEAAYPDMARRLGLDPGSGQIIEFDIADPDFAAAYFEELHHPEERRGVDFWWIDWQQGEASKLPGLDPLWWLNHLHFFDLARDGEKRPFIFSRWGGLGNHRYPIGFSGDTMVSWDSLNFQPYFTATAANVAYGWWSHDIGGHMDGIEEPELYTRWVQFGVFSPIFRLHSTKMYFHERRPWGYDAEVYHITKDAMRLRHALVSYLYSMAWDYNRKARPPIRPMYHDHPDAAEAYICPQQYTFGSQLIAAPYTTPADPDTRLSRQLIWLPPGDWYDFFSGQYYPGDKWQICYGRLDQIPVFAKAGAIVPLGPKVGWGGIDNPAELNLHIFAGANNEFVLYEDDGQTIAYQNGEYCLTTFTQDWRADEIVFRISAVAGQSDLIPQQRQYRFIIYGIHEPETVYLYINDHQIPCNFAYDPDQQKLIISAVELSSDAHLILKLQRPDALLARHDKKVERAREIVSHFRMRTMPKALLYQRLPEITADPTIAATLSTELTSTQMQCLLETLLEAGAYQITGDGQDNNWLLWNNNGDDRATYLHVWEDINARTAETRFMQDKDTIPRTKHLNLDGNQSLTITLADHLFPCQP